MLTFRLPRSAVEAPRFRRPPFFRPVWFQNIAGMFIESSTDWDDVAELLVRSYCVLAPKKLASQIEGGGSHRP